MEAGDADRLGHRRAASSAPSAPAMATGTRPSAPDRGPGCARPGGRGWAGLAADRSLAAHRQGRDDAATQLANDAFDLAGEAKDPDALAWAHGMLGMLGAARGDHDTARRHWSRAWPWPRPCPTLCLGGGLNNLALALRATGEIDLATEHTRTALELCARQGDRHREAAYNNLADLLHLGGRHAEAMDHPGQAVAIFAEVGEPAPWSWRSGSWSPAAPACGRLADGPDLHLQAGRGCRRALGAVAALAGGAGLVQAGVLPAATGSGGCWAPATSAISWPRASPRARCASPASSERRGGRSATARLAPAWRPPAGLPAAALRRRGRAWPRSSGCGCTTWPRR